MAPERWWTDEGLVFDTEMTFELAGVAIQDGRAGSGALPPLFLAMASYFTVDNADPVSRRTLDPTEGCDGGQSKPQVEEF